MGIRYEKQDQVALVTMDRPEAMNCLDQAHLEELGRVWTDFSEDHRLRVAVLTGSGDRAFCVGADLKELIPRITSGQFPIRPTMPGFLKNIRCFKPIIAAVNGACLAGGLEMLQGTDIRIAVAEATFGLPEVKWGLFPAAGSTVRLPRQIPYCCAMEILLVGEPVSAHRALEIGLINRVVPRTDLLPAAMKFASKLCGNGPVAVPAIKESALRAQDLTEEGGFCLEAVLAQQVFGSRDATEGPRAFVEKRKPVFEGR